MSATIEPCKAIYLFSDEEMKLINEHYNTLSPHLQQLMDAAINDEAVALELTQEPCWIMGDGNIFNRKTLTDLLEYSCEGKSTSPLNPQIEFTEKQIYPCNTLIRAMKVLLDYIKDEQLIIDYTGKDTNKTTKKDNSSRNRISPELIVLIEKNYSKFNLLQKQLFDIVCRDPVTDHIMDDPVLLPNGYVHDRSTIPIIFGNDIKEDEITPCHFVITVLDRLKVMFSTLHAAPAQHTVNEVNNEQKYDPPNEHSALINLIEEFANAIMDHSKDLRSVTDYNRLPDKKCLSVAKGPRNEAMRNVLNAAAQTLKTKKFDYLKESESKYEGEYDKVKTIFAGELSYTKSSYVKNFASWMGSVKNQPGWHIVHILDKVHAIFNQQ